MPTISKTYTQFDPAVRESIADRLTPAARERFVADKLAFSVLEYGGAGVVSLENQIAAKRKQGKNVNRDLEDLQWVKKMVAEPVIVIPDDLAA